MQDCRIFFCQVQIGSIAKQLSKDAPNASPTFFVLQNLLFLTHHHHLPEDAIEKMVPSSSKVKFGKLNQL